MGNSYSDTGHVLTSDNRDGDAVGADADADAGFVSDSPVFLGKESQESQLSYTKEEEDFKLSLKDWAKSAPTQQINVTPKKAKIARNDHLKAKESIQQQIEQDRRQKQKQWKKQTGIQAKRKANEAMKQSYNHSNITPSTHNNSNKTKTSNTSNPRSCTLADLERRELEQAMGDNGSTAATTEEKYGRLALWYTNKFREEHGLRPLIWEPSLYKIGEQHSINMALKKVPVGHDGFKDRADAIPYPHTSVGENVAMNYGHGSPPRVAVDGWIKSPGHRKNLLGCWRNCAVGVYQSPGGKWYFTQLFTL